MATKNWQPKPAIISRTSWGAAATQCSSSLGDVNTLVVHHCASSNTSVTNRTEKEHQKWLQGYHMNNRGWCDLGYHFGVGKSGSLLEGRLQSLLGAHVGGQNTGKVGVVVHGDYRSRTFTSTQENNIVSLLAWLCYYYDIEPSSIVGHQDLAATECPGDNIYSALPRIRNTVNYKLYGDIPGPEPI